MNTELLRFIKENNMPLPGARVLCALSGGADSVCMMHILRENGYDILCAHYNHRLRGDESDRDEQFVRDLCEKIGVPLFVGSGDVAAYARENGLGIEEAAREKRYEFLQETAAAHDCVAIATAHNAQDNAETVLMNLSRGAGLKGLCGIPPVRGNIMRPILFMTREEIVSYLAEHGLSHVEDSTNAHDDYARNRLRHHVVPVLREVNSGAVENITRTSETLRQDEELLSLLAGRFIEENLRDNMLSILELRKEHVSIRMRVYRSICGGSLDLYHAKAIDEMCFSDKIQACTHVPGMAVVRDRDSLTFGQSAPATFEPFFISPGERVEIEAAGIAISCEKGKINSEINKSFNTFFFKSESICGRISVTPRAEGDSLRICGRKCTKTIKKLFTEAKIPLNRRELIPVFRDEAGILAVGGFGMAERCAGKAGEDAVIVKIMYVPATQGEREGKLCRTIF